MNRFRTCNNRCKHEWEFQFDSENIYTVIGWFSCSVCGAYTGVIDEKVMIGDDELIADIVAKSDREERQAIYAESIK